MDTTSVISIKKKRLLRNLVTVVNEASYSPEMVVNASCTTNRLAPLAKISPKNVNRNLDKKMNAAMVVRQAFDIGMGRGCMRKPQQDRNNRGSDEKEIRKHWGKHELH